MTIYAPGTPQEAIDADQKLKAESEGNCNPPPPPPRYDSGSVNVKTLAATEASGSSQIRQWAPSGYNMPSVPIAPVYPQRPQGNIGKQVGHVCMTYSNINQEMPHEEYTKMTPDQQTSFHTYGPPMMQAWHPREAPAPASAPASPAPIQEEKSEQAKCGMCRAPGALRKFEHHNTEMITCLACATRAFGANGGYLWDHGKEA